MINSNTIRPEGPAEELVALHPGSTLEAGHHLAFVGTFRDTLLSSLQKGSYDLRNKGAW